METTRRDFLKGLGLGLTSLYVFGLSSTEAQAKIQQKVEDVKNGLPA
jgi:hypothetical protein